MYSIDDYDYDLPPELIAQYPSQRRTNSRLMVLNHGQILHKTFADLPDFLEPGDLLAVNDTRVVPARLFAKKPTGGKVELLVLKETGPGQVKAMFRTKRGLRIGLELEVLERDDRPSGIRLTVTDRFPDGTIQLSHPFETWDKLLNTCGHVALPPYIRRPDQEADFLRYQTVYAQNDGAVAAPTAGLHFDKELLQRIANNGVLQASITLHVGPGTFKPIRVPDIRLHHVDPEWVEVPFHVINRIELSRINAGRVFAVGTTTVRALESAAMSGRIQPFSGPTDLYILPGHRFKVVDCMITNFHLPKSSLMVLVSAFAGLDTIKHAYQVAIEHGYRFFSYGDAMLIIP